VAGERAVKAFVLVLGLFVFSVVVASACGVTWPSTPGGTVMMAPAPSSVGTIVPLPVAPRPPVDGGDVATVPLLIQSQAPYASTGEPPIYEPETITETERPCGSNGGSLTTIYGAPQCSPFFVPKGKPRLKWNDGECTELPDGRAVCRRYPPRVVDCMPNGGSAMRVRWDSKQPKSWVLERCPTSVCGISDYGCTTMLTGTWPSPLAGGAP
jgi:hypothetical protein